MLMMSKLFKLNTVKLTLLPREQGNTGIGSCIQEMIIKRMGLEYPDTLIGKVCSVYFFALSIDFNDIAGL
ncbi:hypothetical protein D3C80_1174340 [compost metagenome]